jgi:hypothetical protein
MFLLVRVRRSALMLVAALGAVAARPPVAPGSSTPTSRQIQAAVREVARSTDLWATFNICNTHTHPNSAGIRGQMPGLGFRAQLSMEFQIHYWSVRDKRFKIVQGADKAVTLGSATTGLHQDGVTFRFAPHAGYLASSVTFDWTIGRTVVAHLTRWTSKGHPDADGGDPPHYSAGRCVIG